MLFNAERFVKVDFIWEVVERTQGVRLCLYGDVSDEMKNGPWITDSRLNILIISAATHINIQMSFLKT